MQRFDYLLLDMHERYKTVVYEGRSKLKAVIDEPH